MITPLSYEAPVAAVTELQLEGIIATSGPDTSLNPTFDPMEDEIEW